MLRFTKMHGAGNDFVVLDLRNGQSPPDPETCARIADRHRGVGCDQLLTVERRAKRARWRRTGSGMPMARRPGNAATVRAASPRGWCAMARRPRRAISRSTARRRPIVSRMTAMAASSSTWARRGSRPQSIPLAGFLQAQDDYVVQLAHGERIEHLRFGAVSMGNPHAVIEVADVDAADVARIGPALQRHAAFPQSVNVGFAQVLSPGHIRLRVYERGVGETLACGSGACAAVAVLVARGRLDGDREVAVDLPGGRLRIRYDRAAGTISMGGPAAFVFEATMQEGSGA